MAEEKKPKAESSKLKAEPAKESTKSKKSLKPADVVAETVVETAAPEKVLEVEAEETKKTTAKAGKRSAKAQAEAEEKQAKETRKSTPTPAEAKTAKKPTRSKLERAGKKYREAAKAIDKSKVYSLKEGLELVVKTSPVKFDATIEMHINLSVDPRQADQNVRDMVTLPAGSGKTVKIAAFAEADDAKKALAAGADIAGTDEIIALLDKEDLNFDVLISTPALMARLGKYAKLLGPRGLMPNPKSGTVTTDVASAVKESKAGRVEYRVDQSGIIHLGIGKASFDAKALADNAQAVVASVKAARPASLKGTYIKSAYLTSTMGPSVKVTI